MDHVWEQEKFNLWMYPDTLEKVDIIYFEKSFYSQESSLPVLWT